MFARGVLVASFLVGTAAFGTIYQSPPHDVALAQDAEADLLATVEALQAQVAEQDGRIDALEEDVKQLETALAMVIVGSGDSASEAASQEKHTIMGSLELALGSRDYRDANFFPGSVDGDQCSGRNSFTDLKGQLQVILLDGSGNTIATGQTEYGAYKRFGETCVFAFTLNNVPDSDFYEIQVGRRQGPTFTREELESLNWEMVLTIG